MATINHKKYDEATETFKDFYVYDGKETLIFKVDGENHKVEITGTLDADNITGSGIIKTSDNGPLSGNAKYLSDGLGNDSVLALSTSRVGIGTTSPAVLLDIVGTSGVGVKVTETGGSEARLVAGGSTAYFGTYSAHPLAILTDSGERMRITSTGDVQLVGNKYLYANPSAGSTTIGSGFNLDGSNNLMTLWTNDTERMRITSAGNVGIGTSSPNYSLQVNSATTTTRLQITNTTTGTSSAQGFQIIQDGNNTTLSLKPSGFMSFETANAERMRITSAGNVVVGGTTAGTSLNRSVTVDTASAGDYSGLIPMTAGVQRGYYGASSTGLEIGVSDNKYLSVWTNGAQRLRVDADGLKFGTDTAAANALDDYEEGTFTATLKGGTTDPTTPVTTTANYTKIGRQVTVSVIFQNINTTGASGDVTVSGLPFSCVTAGIGSVITENFTFAANRTSVSSFVDSAAATTIRLFVSGNDTDFLSLSHNAGTARYLYISLTYFV